MKGNWSLFHEESFLFYFFGNVNVSFQRGIFKSSLAKCVLVRWGESENGCGVCNRNSFLRCYNHCHFVVAWWENRKQCMRGIGDVESNKFLKTIEWLLMILLILTPYRPWTFNDIFWINCFHYPICLIKNYVFLWWNYFDGLAIIRARDMNHLTINVPVFEEHSAFKLFQKKVPTHSISEEMIFFEYSRKVHTVASSQWHSGCKLKCFGSKTWQSMCN